jgi:hypothetical protein
VTKRLVRVRERTGEQEIRMRKVLIVTLGFTSLMASSEIASATPRQISKSDLEAFCNKNNGLFTDGGSGGYHCSIPKVGDWSCTASGACTVSRNIVFTRTPAPKTGASSAPSSTLGNSGKTSIGIGGVTSGANIPAGHTSITGPSASTKPATGSASASVSTSAITSNAGGLPLNGRPRSQQK